MHVRTACSLNTGKKVEKTLLWQAKTDLSGSSNDISDRHKHHILHLQQPFLNSSTSLGGRDDLAQFDLGMTMQSFNAITKKIKWRSKWFGAHLLPFTTEHSQNVQLGVKLQFADSLKALLEMWLHTSGILGL